MTSTWTSRKNSLHFLLICAAMMISVKDSSSQTENSTSTTTVTVVGLTPSPTTTNAIREAETAREVTDHAETAVKDTTTNKGIYLAKAKTIVTSTKSLVTSVKSSTAEHTTTSGTKTTLKADAKFEFDHDYKTLRRNGLIAAAIFFLVGILIIPCARVKRSRPKFSIGRKRSYTLTQP
ncbi:FXYD domain containing ion transport regulator 5 isoform X1 [Erpetoichthys calabaricus]|uniref:FXYD domain containing ion transport regulator 5 isoform X1 n=1 Tax=Erpetoichthys calabaricus TaxID=27687 RepID=UPI0010A06386|nr:FXYD domain containing ion transport regulator 5 isoform X1 [Erpetoichthys calabaricus]